MRIQKVFVASDHAGFRCKQTVVEWLQSMNVSYEDLGPYTDDVSVDYPDFAQKVGNAIQKQKDTYGVLICGSGIGISIAANKIPFVRAALCSEPVSAKLSRLHNNANVLCMAGRLIGPTMAQDILSVFLSTEFEGGRHENRIQKIHLLEGKLYEN
ncbi:MAG: ribose 5-phosphate isomerase B [Caldisericia bacterium]|nr:ribose 5-phosphate isomerase B [Caldisericia bacterium]MDD4614049.1 ribose 5-phosphate isomerase B [Caldisericia bacterium]